MNLSHDGNELGRGKDGQRGRDVDAEEEIMEIKQLHFERR